MSDGDLSSLHAKVLQVLEAGSSREVVQAIQEALGCIAGNGDIRPDKVGLVPLVWLRLNSISGGPLQACGT